LYIGSLTVWSSDAYELTTQWSITSIRTTNRISVRDFEPNILIKGDQKTVR